MARDLFQGVSALKAQKLTAWGNAPGYMVESEGSPEGAEGEVHVPEFTWGVAQAIGSCAFSAPRAIS